MSAFEGVNVPERSNSLRASPNLPRRRSAVPSGSDVVRRRPSWAPSAAQSESWLAIDAEIQAAAQAEEEQNKTATPLPRQLWVICLMRLAEPVSFAQIFPYINRMIMDLGAAKSPTDVGMCCNFPS